MISIHIGSLEEFRIFQFACVFLFCCLDVLVERGFFLVAGEHHALACRNAGLIQEGGSGTSGGVLRNKLVFFLPLGDPPVSFRPSNFHNVSYFRLHANFLDQFVEGRL